MSQNNNNQPDLDIFRLLAETSSPPAQAIQPSKTAIETVKPVFKAEPLPIASAVRYTEPKAAGKKSIPHFIVMGLQIALALVVTGAILWVLVFYVIKPDFIYQEAHGSAELYSKLKVGGLYKYSVSFTENDASSGDQDYVWDDKSIRGTIYGGYEYVFPKGQHPNPGKNVLYLEVKGKDNKGYYQMEVNHFTNE